MAYYPAFLELDHRPCLVIGGGAVACRKTKALLVCGAKVRVVSPKLTSDFRRLIRQGKVRWRKKRFQPSDLKGAQLVVAATEDQSVNKEAAHAARKRCLWINVVDQPGLCSFIVPSVVRRGRLTLAISTGGASPALSKWIRRDLERRYGPEFKRLVSRMAKMRGGVLEKIRGVRHRKALFEKALQAYFKVLKKR